VSLLAEDVREQGQGKISGTNFKEERERFGKLYEYNVELCDLCLSQDVILVIKLRKNEGREVKRSSERRGLWRRS
jgi:hypothetical protein